MISLENLLGKDQEVLRPTPLRHEQYVNEVIEYSSPDFREIYMSIFQITSLPRQLFVGDLVPKPKTSEFFKKVNVKKTSLLINMGYPETLWN